MALAAATPADAARVLYSFIATNSTGGGDRTATFISNGYITEEPVLTPLGSTFDTTPCSGVRVSTPSSVFGSTSLGIGVPTGAGFYLTTAFVTDGRSQPGFYFQ